MCVIAIFFFISFQYRFFLVILTLVYATGGRELLMLEVVVDMANNVVTER